MTPTIKNIKNDTLSSSHSVLVDTNFLLKWFPTDNSGPGIYGDYLKELIARKTPIVITSSVISEFINRHLRDYFYDHSSQYNDDYKHVFRESDDYYEKLKDASDLIRSFLFDMNLKVDVKELVPKYPNKTDILNQVLEHLQNQPIDFTDSILINIANQNQIAILSDDKDLQRVNLPWAITIYTTQPI